MTVFNQSSEQSLSYSPPSSPGEVYIQFAVYAIATVGLIGIARGPVSHAPHTQSTHEISAGASFICSAEYSPSTSSPSCAASEPP